MSFLPYKYEHIVCDPCGESVLAGRLVLFPDPAEVKVLELEQVEEGFKGGLAQRGDKGGKDVWGGCKSKDVGHQQEDDWLGVPVQPAQGLRESGHEQVEVLDNLDQLDQALLNSVCMVLFSLFLATLLNRFEAVFCVLC